MVNVWRARRNRSSAFVTTTRTCPSKSRRRTKIASFSPSAPLFKRARKQESKKQEQFLEFSKQSRKLLGRLQQWIEEHKADIAEAFMTVRHSAFLLLIVQNHEAFNQDLEDSLTDLDLSIAQDEDYNLIRLNVLALPKASRDSIDSFLTLGGEVA
ncbi:MAG: hypothetical protein U0793_31920 [Gemmataceae bacterium]